MLDLMDLCLAVYTDNSNHSIEMIVYYKTNS